MVSCVPGLTLRCALRHSAVLLRGCYPMILTVVNLHGGVAAAGAGVRLHRGVRLRPLHFPLAGTQAEDGQLQQGGGKVQVNDSGALGEPW